MAGKVDGGGVIKGERNADESIEAIVQDISVKVSQVVRQRENL